MRQGSKEMAGWGSTETLSDDSTAAGWRSGWGKKTPASGRNRSKVWDFKEKPVPVRSKVPEVRVAKVHSLEELNQKWKYFLEQDYQKEAHDGIREYYESQGAKVPAEGISPMQEWNRICSPVEQIMKSSRYPPAYHGWSTESARKHWCTHINSRNGW